MIAARILAYGAKYDVTYNGVDQEIDLSTLENLPIDESLYKRDKNEFSYTLPHTKNDVTFKILTGHDERKIEAELKSLKKISKTASNEVTVRLYRTITSVNGSTEAKDIKEFTSNYFLAKDVREFRKYYKSVNPDVDMDVTVINDEGEEEIVALPIGLRCFWPAL